MRKFTAEEIGHKSDYPLVQMLLLNPHDHDFWYKKPDGTWYGYSKRKDHDPEEWFWEVDGRQIELKLDLPKSKERKYYHHPKTGQACSGEEYNDYMENHYKPLPTDPQFEGRKGH